MSNVIIGFTKVQPNCYTCGKGLSKYGPAKYGKWVPCTVVFSQGRESSEKWSWFGMTIPKCGTTLGTTIRSRGE